MTTSAHIPQYEFAVMCSKYATLYRCANGSRGYFPTQAAYDYRSYEGTTCYFARGCAEAILKLLNTLK